MDFCFNARTGSTVFTASLENGEYKKAKITGERTCLDLINPVKTAEFSGRGVVIMSEDQDVQSPIDGMRKGSLRTVDHKDIIDHAWGKKALEMLKKNTGITAAEPGITVETIGGIRYAQRLASFYTNRGSEYEKPVRPIFRAYASNKYYRT